LNSNNNERKDKIRRFLEKNPRWIDKLPEYFSQIETIAISRISSSLKQQLGINIPVPDQEGKSGQYWERLRDLAKLGREKCETFRDPQELIEFIERTEKTLSEVIIPEERERSLLEVLLFGDEENEDKPSDKESLEEEQTLWSDTHVFGHLTPFIYTRKGENSETILLEATKGEIVLSTTELKKVILRLELIYELIEKIHLNRIRIKMKTDEEETRLLRILTTIRKWKQENTVEFESWNLGEQLEFRKKLWEMYTRKQNDYD